MRIQNGTAIALALTLLSTAAVAKMSAEDVASVIYYVTTLPDNLCINDLVVTCLAQANSFYTNKN